MTAAQLPSQQNGDVDKQQDDLARPEANGEKQRSTPQIVEVAEVTEVAEVKKSEQIKQSALPSDENKKVAEVKLLKVSNESQEKPPGSQEGGAIQKERCFTLGPFRDLDNLRSLTREIKPYVVTTDFRGREEREQYLYWVYIQPEKNRKKAIETGQRLKAKKIKDFYIIREGEKIHGVSLGRFRNKNSAYGLAKKVKKFGFDVIVEPVFKIYTVYWLDYQLADGVSIPETLYEHYTQSTKKGKVSRLSRSCGAEMGE
ncbi:MAG: SPOR domain-containing protein [Gammaproteobacteria bacterium]